MMKTIYALAAVAAFALIAAPAAHASCSDVQAQITAHNHAYVDTSNQADVDAYNAEADRLEAAQNDQCR